MIINIYKDGNKQPSSTAYTKLWIELINRNESNKNILMNVYSSKGNS